MGVNKRGVEVEVETPCLSKVGVKLSLVKAPTDVGLSYLPVTA